MFYRSNYFVCCDFSVPKNWKNWLDSSMQPRRFMCFSAFPLSLVNFSNESRKPAGAKDLSPEKQCLSWGSPQMHVTSEVALVDPNSIVYILYSFLDKHVHIRMYCPWSAASMYTYLYNAHRSRFNFVQALSVSLPKASFDGLTMIITSQSFGNSWAPTNKSPSHRESAELGVTLWAIPSPSWFQGMLQGSSPS